MSAHYLNLATGSPRRTPPEYTGLTMAGWEPEIVFPTTFNAKNKKPLEIIRPLVCGRRLVHRDMPWWAFVLVDGACSNNGRLGAQAGWAVAYGSKAGTDFSQAVSGRLEEKGPLGCQYAPTSNRAELRASIAALRLCSWRQEGFKRLVIATDSSYVVDGATSWSKIWLCNGWKTSTGAQVQNQDLWDMLLGDISWWDTRGLRVLFWKIPRELNREADAAAKAASLYGLREPEFVDWVIRNPDPPSSVTEMAPVKPWERVVIFCPHSKELVDSRYQPLLSRLHRHAYNLELGQTTEQCYGLLSKGKAPSVILITDNALCWSAALSVHVLAHLRNGCIIVLTGEFGRSQTENVSNWMSDTFGVAWRLGDTSRDRAERSMAFGVQQPRVFHMLPHAYKQCGLSVTGVTPREQVYIQEGGLGRTPTAVARIDQGYLCFVGDESPTSEDVIMAMCCGLYD